MIGVGVGSVSIVGAGPGDPDLITVKALKKLRSADIIMYDRLVSEELLQYASPRTMLVYCGKSPGHHAMPQDEINKRLIDYALEGKRVVRLKGGDPFVFGRGGEEALELAVRGIPLSDHSGDYFCAGCGGDVRYSSDSSRHSYLFRMCYRQSMQW